MKVFDEIVGKIQKASIPPRILLSKFRFIDEASRYSRECLDPYYMPFYYFLGRHIPAKSLVEIGFGLGLNASCYLMGSPDTETYLSVQEPPQEYYSSRIGIGNVKRVWRHPFFVHVGNVHDEVFTDKLIEHKWDVALISDKKEYDIHMMWLNTLWETMKDDGVICMDYTTSHKQAERAYNDFCVIKHREPYVFPTRYGVGIIVK